MSAGPHSPTPKPSGPGFVAAILDIPFALPIPNGAYLCRDPKKGIAVIQTIQREGSHAFFRNRSISGPTSFEDLRQLADQHERPKADYSYLVTAKLPDGTERAALNIHTGKDGGYAEAKGYSEVNVCFLTDDLMDIGKEDFLLSRTAEVLNPFLDKYRALVQDYRVGRVSRDRNFYVAVSHTSPLLPDELSLSSEELFNRLRSTQRTWLRLLGAGSTVVLRLPSLESLPTTSLLDSTVQATFEQFIREEYELPLSYDLILDALRSMQMLHDFKLAIVHAATAVEVHVLHLLY